MNDRTASQSSRLTPEECRKLIGKDCKLTDQELEKLRDSMYELADIVIEAYLEKRNQDKRQAKKTQSGQTS